GAAPVWRYVRQDAALFPRRPWRTLPGERRRSARRSHPNVARAGLGRGVRPRRAGPDGRRVLAARRLAAVTLLAADARKPAEMTTSHRRFHTVVAGLAAVLALAACAQTGQPTARTSPAPGATATPQTTRDLQTCFGTAPAAWAGTQRASLPTTRFDPQVVAASGDRAYGGYQTVTGVRGIAALDLNSGALNPLVTSPVGTAGVLGFAVAPPWLAWVQ